MIEITDKNLKMNKIKKAFNSFISHRGKKLEKKKFSACPIILGACPRSGTTLLLSILSAHPSIHAIKKQTYAFTEWNDKGRPKRLDRLYREFLLPKISSESIRWCEKTPKNVEYFGEILNYFSEVKLIHLIRDGRDVVTSRHPRRNPEKYWVSPQRWMNNVKAALAFKDNDNVYTIFYEKLIKNFEEEIKKLCEFLNEKVEDHILNWTENTSLQRSKHWKKPVQKLHARSIGRWKEEQHKERIVDFYSNTEAFFLLKELNYI